MADIYFSDWDRLVKEVDKKATQILKKDVASVAENILKKHIKSDIYDAYTPKENGWVNGTTYQRRHIMEDAVTSVLQDHNTLLVTIRKDVTASPSIIKGGAFLKLIESGNTGIWRSGFPRPVVSNTQAEFETSSEIKSAIKKGIQREIGICIEI